MNDHGAATSAVAAVTVSIPEPQLRFLSLLANGFTFTYESIAGVLYVVEYCESLTAGPWTESNRRFGSGGTEVVTDPNASSAARFYRVRAVYAPPPAMSGTVRNGNTASFEFTTVEGAIYVVEYKSNLADPAWLELSRHAGTGTSIDITDPGAHEPSRFYRVRVE